MTVKRIESTLCAGWLYTNDIGHPDWIVILRDPQGDWVQLDDGGISYHQTPEGLRSFLDDWIADSAFDADDPGPNTDTLEAYRAAADFIEQAAK